MKRSEVDQIFRSDPREGAPIVPPPEEVTDARKRGRVGRQSVHRKAVLFDGQRFTVIHEKQYAALRRRHGWTQSEVEAVRQFDGSTGSIGYPRTTVIWSIWALDRVQHRLSQVVTCFKPVR